MLQPLLLLLLTRFAKRFPGALLNRMHFGLALWEEGRGKEREDAGGVVCQTLWRFQVQSQGCMQEGAAAVARDGASCQLPTVAVEAVASIIDTKRVIR